MLHDDDGAISIISIHALREESDRLGEPVSGDFHLFQSTLSVRRATTRRAMLDRQRRHFNPRSP